MAALVGNSKSTMSCRLRADAPTEMRTAKGKVGLTTGRIDKVSVLGDKPSPHRKPLPAYKRVAGPKGGRTLTAAQARNLRMRGK